MPDLTANVRVSCTTPAGPAPMLNVQPLFQTLPPPTINTSSSVTVEYLGGFTNQSSAVFTCTSSTGYELRGYIVTESGKTVYTYKLVFVHEFSVDECHFV